MLNIDQQLLLSINGFHFPLFDAVAWQLSDTRSWLLVALCLLFIVWRENKVRHAVMFVCGLALAIALADQLSATVVKPLVCRLRPTHDPAIMSLVHTVRHYRGGSYGFVSSHAANVFAVITYVGLVAKKRWLLITFLSWAMLVCWSRIYLGVHYPGDVLGGAVLGAFCGGLCHVAFAIAESRTRARGGFTLTNTWFVAWAMWLTLLAIFLIPLFRLAL